LISACRGTAISRSRWVQIVCFLPSRETCQPSSRSFLSISFFSYCTLIGVRVAIQPRLDAALPLRTRNGRQNLLDTPLRERRRSVLLRSTHPVGRRARALFFFPWNDVDNRAEQPLGGGLTTRGAWAREQMHCHRARSSATVMGRATPEPILLLQQVACMITTLVV
jgi:hypothetical protein